MNDYYIFDIEADNLLEDITKIHCLSFAHVYNGSITRGSYTDLKAISVFFSVPNRVFVGHNIIRYDIPAAKKILGIHVTGKLYDTLGLSWYLYPNRIVQGKKHGLESWGDDLGIPKPVIEDWENQSIQDYLHRCQSDVEANLKLFMMMLDYLLKIYGDWNQVMRLMGYLSYKLECAREQEEIKWKVDIERCSKGIEKLTPLEQHKIQTLSGVMPLKVDYKEVNKPTKMTKKDDSPTIAAIKWFELLESKSLPLDYSDTIKVIKSEEAGNPNSHTQLKDWLFKLGWKPETFKSAKTKLANTQEKREVQIARCEKDLAKGYLKWFKIKDRYIEKESVQVSLPDGKGICDSVKALYSVQPELKELDDLYIIIHRLGILRGFLENTNEEGFIKAEIKGFTNTLRFQHTTLVNLPAHNKAYSEDIRGSLIAPDENHILCGSDMVSLEDSTKQHYMYFFDPDYVNEMRVPGFDPHLDIAVLAEMLTQEESDFHKWYEKTKKEDLNHEFTLEEKDKFSSINIIRKEAKPVNFGGVYGAGPAKLAKTLRCSLAFATKLHKTYWERNKAVKQVARSVRTKTIDGNMWLFNPVSRFWYSLRFKKDIFSTLNQGTGVYCFDSWVRKVRGREIKVCGQFHDEIITPLLRTGQEKVRKILLDSIKETNDELKLNVELGISVDFGNSYAEIH